MALSFRAFTVVTTASTEKAWKADIPKCKNVFPGRVISALNLLSNHVDYEAQGPTCMSYGVFDTGTNIASGIVEVIVTKQGRKLAKMLDCHVRPILADKMAGGAPDAEAVMEIVNVYVTSVLGAFELSGEHKVNQVKVYGRSPELLSILVEMEKAVARRKLPLKVRIEDRWLVLNT